MEQVNEDHCFRDKTLVGAHGMDKTQTGPLKSFETSE